MGHVREPDRRLAGLNRKGVCRRIHRVAPRRASRRAVLLALLVCLLSTPDALAADAPRTFYGVIAASDPDRTEVARMGAGRVGTLRINLVWGAVQSAPGSELDWSHYDELIGNAAREGIRVLPTVYSSPRWSAARVSYPPSRPTWGEFAHFVRAAAGRYGSRGVFWSEHPDIAAYPIRDWQFWNEPNLQGFWLPKLSARTYVNLLRVFSRAVRGGDPTARVLLGGLFPNARAHSTVPGIPLKRYLPAVYRQRAKPLFDAVDLHPYAATPRRVLVEVKRARRIMDRFGDRKTTIWLTEIGWTTGGAPSALTVSPERQATYLTRTFDLLAANRARYRIGGAVWYSWRDLPGPAWFNHTGLFTEDLEPKPAWSAFVGLTGGWLS
jgi:polysaccharide biosynthesis protein PslG